MAVLDAWALLAYLEGEEPAASRVEQVMRGERSARASWINLGEVAYIVARRRSFDHARALVSELAAVLDPVEPRSGQVLAAARIKADYRMSYADAFAVATANELGLPLWTGDREILASGVEVDVVDLRSWKLTAAPAIGPV